MQLNSKNWFARYYYWIYDSLPNDLCSFFWGLLFAILLSPLIIFGRLLIGRDEPLSGYIGIGIIVWLFTAASFAIGGKTLEITHLLIYLNGLSAWVGIPILILAGVITILLVFGTIGVICFGLSKSFDYITDYKKDGSPRVNLHIRDWIGAIRGKYCTPIKWK